MRRLFAPIGAFFGRLWGKRAPEVINISLVGASGFSREEVEELLAKIGEVAD